MKNPVFCTAGDSQALRHAINQLSQWGYDVLHAPTPEVTHLLLPVPSLETDGRLKGGQRLEDVLQPLPANATILGGNLPALSHRHIDFLQDEHYLQENAGITAQCTLELLRRQNIRLSGATALLIGWGRISKQLAPLLRTSGVNVTVAARKESDRQQATQFGYKTIEAPKWDARQFDIIISTAPAPLLDQTDTRTDALLVDLASVQSISGDRVIWARGLPNKEAPDASGVLIAKTALRYALRKELL